MNQVTWYLIPGLPCKRHPAQPLLHTGRWRLFRGMGQPGSCPSLATNSLTLGKMLTPAELGGPRQPQDCSTLL